MAREAVSGRMQAVFVIAVTIMLAHKVECWFTEEWLESPFFQMVIARTDALSPDHGDAVGEAIFLTFILWLFIGLGMIALVMRGGWGPLVVLGIWGLTFFLEMHHLVRSALLGGYYTGTASALLYVPFGVLYWATLVREIRAHRAAGARREPPDAPPPG